MGKKIFWFFILFVSVSVGSVLMYVQSSYFANFIKNELDEKVSKDSGLLLEFDRLKVDVLPPGVSLVNVRLKVLRENNILDLSKDTVFRADRAGVIFRMVQAFSRGITINKLYLSGAEAKVTIPNSPQKKHKESESISKLITKPIQIQVSKNFFVSIRQLEIRDTKLDLSGESDGKKWSFSSKKVNYLALSPGHGGTNIITNLEGIAFEQGKTHVELEVFDSNADITPQAITISTVDIKKDQIASHIEGHLAGNIDKPEQLHADIRTISRAALPDIMVQVDGPKGFQGQLYAELRLSGELSKIHAQGKATIDRFVYSMWNLDKISLDVSYDASKVLIENLNFERKGGVVSVKEANIDLPLKSMQNNLEIAFSNAALHEFAGDLNKSINSVEANLNGMIKASVALDKVGEKMRLRSLQLDPQLQIHDFHLNNQVYGKVRKRKDIIAVKQMDLAAQIKLQDGVATISNGSLTLPTGKIAVQGNVTDKNGWDLKGSTDEIDLGKELGHIAEIPATGAGALSIHVQGPADKVMLHFDVDLEDVKYVNFDLGSVFGRITYDDDKSILYLKKIEAVKNESQYTLDGLVDVGDTDKIDLQTHFSDTRPDDLFSIFAVQLKKLTWIPHGMTGLLQGDAHVGGGYNDWEKTLNVKATLSGAKLSYKGEVIDSVRTDAGFEKGTYYAKNVVMEKYSTHGTGEIFYYPDNRMKYNFQIPNGKIRDLNYISGRELPLYSFVEGSGSGEGTWENLKSHAEFNFTNAFVRTRSIPPLKAVLDTDPNSIKFSVSTAASPSLFSLNLGNREKDHSSLAMDFTGHNFSYLLCYLNKSACVDPALNLEMNLKMASDWTGRDWEKMSGGGELKDFLLAKNNLKIRSQHSQNFKISGGVLNIPHLEVAGEDSRLGIDVDGRVNGENLKITSVGYLPLRTLEFLTPLIEESRGKLELNTSLFGNINDTKFSGSIAIKDGFLRFSGLDAAAENLMGKIKLSNNRAEIDSIVGTMGSGSVRLGGGAELFLNKAPVLNLELTVRDNRVKFYPVSFAEVDEGKLTFTGEQPPYQFAGLVKMRKAVMRNNFDNGGKKQLRAARYLPTKAGDVKSIYEVKIRAIAEGGILVDNDLLNAEFRGEITLLNNFEFPQIIGRAELVKGKLLFRNTAFTLDHAFVRMPSPEIFDPQFSVGGTATLDAYKINIFASGTMNEPKITLSSSPALAQEDILSLLAFGFRGEDVRYADPGDMSAITYSEVGSALMDQLRINKDLQSKGVRVTVAPSFKKSEKSIVRPNEVGENAAAPKVLVQSEIFKNLDATLGSTFGASQSQELDANLEYRLSKKASLNMVYEQESQLEANENKSSYGADLKFRWGFK